MSRLHLLQPWCASGAVHCRGGHSTPLQYLRQVCPGTHFQYVCALCPAFRKWCTWAASRRRRPPRHCRTFSINLGPTTTRSRVRHCLPTRHCHLACRLGGPIYLALGVCSPQMKFNRLQRNYHQQVCASTFDNRSYDPGGAWQNRLPSGGRAAAQPEAAAPRA